MKELPPAYDKLTKKVEADMQRQRLQIAKERSEQNKRKMNRSPKDGK